MLDIFTKPNQQAKIDQLHIELEKSCKHSIKIITPADITQKQLKKARKAIVSSDDYKQLMIDEKASAVVLKALSENIK